MIELQKRYFKVYTESCSNEDVQMAAAMAAELGINQITSKLSNLHTGGFLFSKVKFSIFSNTKLQKTDGFISKFEFRNLKLL